MGEGAGILILEEWDHARRARRDDLRRSARRGLDRRRAPHHRARSHRVTARFAAWSSRSQTPSYAREDVSHINAHGTSTPLNDLAESVAVRSVFGDDAPPTTSIKGHLGHSLAAAGPSRASPPCSRLLQPADSRRPLARPTSIPRSDLMSSSASRERRESKSSCRTPLASAVTTAASIFRAPRRVTTATTRRSDAPRRCCHTPIARWR